MLIFISFLALNLATLGLTQETTQQATICNENEVFQQSGYECTCRSHCYNRDSPGCFCREGYSREIRGICIPNDICPPPKGCPPNQVYVSCANPCMPTCEDPNGQLCQTVNCTAGCVCNGEFVLQGNGSDAICIRREDCPSQKSESIQPVETEQPAQSGQPGQSGQEDQQHDEPNQEPGSNQPQCPENQEFMPNGTECICDEHCYFKRSPSCICKEAHIKQNGVCITRQQCLGNRTQTCGPNQGFYPCVNPCQPTCDDPDKAPCDSFSCIPGCMCNPGFYLEGTGDNARCVPKEQCGSQNNEPSDGETGGQTRSFGVHQRHHQRHHDTKHHNNARHHGNEARHHNARHHTAKHHNARHHNAKHHNARHHNQERHHE